MPKNNICWWSLFTSLCFSWKQLPMEFESWDAMFTMWLVPKSPCWISAPWTTKQHIYQSSGTSWAFSSAFGIDLNILLNSPETLLGLTQSYWWAVYPNSLFSHTSARLFCWSFQGRDLVVKVTVPLLSVLLDGGWTHLWRSDTTSSHLKSF